MLHLARRAAAAASAATVLALAVPGTASAGTIHSFAHGQASVSGTSCPGRIIGQGTLVAGHSRGVWQLYYSSANGGTNCLMVRNLSGGTHHMGVNLMAYDPARETDAYDEGNYTRYAGAARVWGTAHECIAFLAGYDGHTHKEQRVHCG